MFPDVPRTRVRRRREKRSLAEEQESLKSIVTKDTNLSNNNKDVDAGRLRNTESDPSNSKDADVDPTRLRNITNAQLHSNSPAQPSNQSYSSHYAFQSPSSQSPSSVARLRSEGGNLDRIRHGRGYHSEGPSTLHDSVSQNVVSSSDNFPPSSGVDLRTRIRASDDKTNISTPSSTSSGVSSLSSDQKYKYANGSPVTMPAEELSSKHKYGVTSEKYNKQKLSPRDSGLGSNISQDFSNNNKAVSNSNNVPTSDGLSSDSSVSSGGTLTISISGPDGQSESRVPPAHAQDGHVDMPGCQTTAPASTRLEGDNISLSSTVSSLSTSSITTTDSCSTISSTDVAKRQSVSSLSDLEHLGEVPRTWHRNHARIPHVVRGRVGGLGYLRLHLSSENKIGIEKAFVIFIYGSRTG